MSPSLRLADSHSQYIHQFTSVAQSCPTLWPQGPQHARPPCPSPTPRVYPNSCPLCQSCHPTISSSIVPFSSCLQSFPASWSFQMIHFFASDGQSIGVSASKLVLPMNTQDWSPLGWTGWISLQSKGLSRVFSNTTEVQNRTSLSLLQGTLLSQEGPRSKKPKIKLIWKSVYILLYYSEISKHIKISKIQ